MSERLITFKLKNILMFLFEKSIFGYYYKKGRMLRQPKILILGILTRILFL